MYDEPGYMNVAIWYRDESRKVEFRVEARNVKHGGASGPESLVAMASALASAQPAGEWDISGLPALSPEP